MLTRDHYSTMKSKLTWYSQGILYSQLKKITQTRGNWAMVMRMRVSAKLTSCTVVHNNRMNFCILIITQINKWNSLFSDICFQGSAYELGNLTYAMRTTNRI